MWDVRSEVGSNVMVVDSSSSDRLKMIVAAPIGQQVQRGAT
jgi:hypothetical protein